MKNKNIYNQIKAGKLKSTSLSGYAKLLGFNFGSDLAINFLNNIAQVINGTNPLVNNGYMPFALNNGYLKNSIFLGSNAANSKLGFRNGGFF